MGDYTVVDLFSGCGGMSWGLHKSGFQIVAGVDESEPALNTFALNHPHAQCFHQEITTLEPFTLMKQCNLQVGELDCLVGGPPCQGFSKNVPASYRFQTDPRNQLFRVFLKFAETLQPKTIIMENVAPIYNAYGGNVRQEIVDLLEKLGYMVEVQRVWAHKYGVPQKRQRCFFLASRTGVPLIFPAESFAQESEQTLFQTYQPYRSAWSAISDLPVLRNGEGHEPMQYANEPVNAYQEMMRGDSCQLYDHVTRELRPKQYARISSLRPGEGLKQLPDELRPKSGYSGAYGRLDFEMVAPTITRWVFHPGSGRFCHPREPRLLTIREAARLQSFSDEFRFTGTYIQKSHQVGNAVPPLLMQKLADNIKRCLNVSNGEQATTPPHQAVLVPALN